MTIALNGKQSKAVSPWLYIVLILGIALRLVGMDAPLSSDELASASIWAQMPFIQIISNYQYANNHIFLTLILSFILKLFGVNEVALRTPVLACGVLSLFLAYITTLRITRTPSVALGAAFLLAISAPHIYYSTNARGYMLIMVFSQIILHRILVWLQDGLPVSRRKILFDILTLGTLCFLGTWTLPTFILFEVSLGIFFVLALLRGLKIQVRAAWVLLTLIICLCGFYIQYYIFISRDMLKFGMSNSAADGKPLSDLIPAVLNEWIHPFEPSLFMLVVLALFGMILVLKTNREAFYLLASIMIVPHVGVAVFYILGAIPSVPSARVFIYLQPFFFTAVALGGYFIAETAQRLLAKPAFPITTGIFYGLLFIPLVCLAINELKNELYPERLGREPFNKVLRFIEKLGPQDLILASDQSHVWFYLYGASEMRKRVENIIDTQTMGDIYFIVYTHNKVSDMQPAANYFKFTDYAYIGEKHDLLLPATLFQPAVRFDNFEFYKVKPQYIQAGNKLRNITDMENWLTIGASLLRLEPLKTSKGIQMAVGGATTLVSRNPADGDFLSINLISSTDNTLYLNASLKDNHMTFNKSWMANQWTLDHPYGNTIFNKK